MIIDFINNNSQTILSILGSTLVAIGGFIGKKYSKYINNKEKSRIVDSVVAYVEQKTKSTGISAEERFRMAEEKALRYLNDEKIKISREQLEILIENAVISFKKEVK